MIGGGSVAETEIRRVNGCKGHRIFIGGPLDGHVDHMICTTESDFPLFWQYPARDDAFYERDLDGGTEAYYRFMGADR